jgi:ubiquinone/menaquinone biosynthesis C-methylase UbiE/uncharacterized protein YbaR (Trm112 family)
MKNSDLNLYICPGTLKPLTFRNPEIVKGEILSGAMVSENGEEYPISEGVPDLRYPLPLPLKDESARSFYEDRGEAYDANLYLTFKTHGEDEMALRNKFVDALELKPSHRVLEVACGTGRDSEIIAQRLGADGQLCVTDISKGMLRRCEKRLVASLVPTNFALANATHLPFPNGYFDAVYSFGGLGEFSDIRRSLSEMVRVSRVGAKIVVGDESMPPWLRETEFAKILVTTNKQFLAPVPLEEMPVQARDVCLRWVIGGVFYLIEFRVAEGEPQGDFDFEIPGIKGGTLRTRYVGQLESVTPETKRLAERAREKKGISMHKWLEDVIRRAAEQDLKGGEF